MKASVINPLQSWTLTLKSTQRTWIRPWRTQSSKKIYRISEFPIFRHRNQFFQFQTNNYSPRNAVPNVFKKRKRKKSWKLIWANSICKWRRWSTLSKSLRRENSRTPSAIGRLASALNFASKSSSSIFYSPLWCSRSTFWMVLDYSASWPSVWLYSYACIARIGFIKSISPHRRN